MSEHTKCAACDRPFFGTACPSCTYASHPADKAALDGAHAPVDSKIAAGSKKSAPFLLALTEIWRVSQFGEKKHGANNWMQAKPDGMWHYEAALWRHWIERRQGETHASDSKCLHLAHMAWNAIMLLEMELRGVTNPDWAEYIDEDA